MRHTQPRSTWRFSKNKVSNDKVAARAGRPKGKGPCDRLPRSGSGRRLVRLASLVVIGHHGRVKLLGRVRAGKDALRHSEGRLRADHNYHVLLIRQFRSSVGNAITPLGLCARLAMGGAMPARSAAAGSATRHTGARSATAAFAAPGAPARPAVRAWRAARPGHP